MKSYRFPAPLPVLQNELMLRFPISIPVECTSSETDGPPLSRLVVAILYDDLPRLIQTLSVWTRHELRSVWDPLQRCFMVTLARPISDSPFTVTLTGTISLKGCTCADSDERSRSLEQVRKSRLLPLDIWQMVCNYLPEEHQFTISA